MPHAAKTATDGSDEPPKHPKLSKLDDTLAYVFHDILKIDENSPIILAMRENLILSFDELLGRTEAQIEALMYMPIGSKDPQPLMTTYYLNINWLRKWNLHLMLENDRVPLTDYEWGQLSKQEYRKFLLYVQTG